MPTVHIRATVGMWMCVFHSSIGGQEAQFFPWRPGGSVSDQALRSSSQQSGEAGHTSVCLETALAPFPGSQVREPLFGNIPVMTREACLP